MAVMLTWQSCMHAEAGARGYSIHVGVGGLQPTNAERHHHHQCGSPRQSAALPPQQAQRLARHPGQSLFLIVFNTPDLDVLESF